MHDFEIIHSSFFVGLAKYYIFSFFWIIKAILFILPFLDLLCDVHHRVSGKMERLR